MAFSYNKLCNKQDAFFSRSYLHKGQRSPKCEFKKTYKPFDLIKSCLVYANIFYPPL